MTSLDQENLRRAQAERRIAMQGADSGGAGWLIGIVVVVAIIAGIFLFGGSGGDGTATTAAPVTEDVAPAATDEAAPATTVTE
ncbi:MAG: hypothetical protein AAFQ64_13285 [Pseudomonadota bacterium]